MPRTRLGLAARPSAADHLHQAADAGLVKVLERIALIDLVVIVSGQELGGIVTAEAEGHLGQVVGAEAEEVRFLGDLAGGQGRARDLDHGANLVLHVNAGFGNELVRSLDDDVLDKLQLLDFANQRDHDVRPG